VRDRVSSAQSNGFGSGHQAERPAVTPGYLSIRQAFRYGKFGLIGGGCGQVVVWAAGAAPQWWQPLIPLGVWVLAAATIWATWNIAEWQARRKGTS